MKWNPWMLPLLLGGALSMVYFLPSAGEIANSAVKMELPGTSGGWSFETQTASEEEVKTLAGDTEFAKAMCWRARPGEVTLDGRLVPDRVDLSIVLSGTDLNNSIHRPERCMPAQGHSITSSGSVSLKLENGRELPVRRLHSVQTVGQAKDDGAPIEFKALTYYFFIGHDQITNDHVERTLIDMKDRLVHGLDQRWAYVSTSMWYGKLPWIEKEITEAEADKKLRKFLSNFAENQIDWRQISK